MITKAPPEAIALIAVYVIVYVVAVLNAFDAYVRAIVVTVPGVVSVTTTEPVY